MTEQVSRTMNLSEFIQSEIDKSSIRKVARRIGIGPTTVNSLAKGQRKKAPDVETLEKIAQAYGLTMGAVVEMAGAMMNDHERYQVLAREIDTHPWLAEEWGYLTSISRDEFKEAMDYIKYRQRHPRFFLPPNGDQSNP